MKDFSLRQFLVLIKLNLFLADIEGQKKNNKFLVQQNQGREIYHPKN